MADYKFRGFPVERVAFFARDEAACMLDHRIQVVLFINIIEEREGGAEHEYPHQGNKAQHGYQQFFMFFQKGLKVSVRLPGFKFCFRIVR